jgi:hypothetical protein
MSDEYDEDENDDVWNNDLIQFARLLCEVAATDIKLDEIAEEMDLSVEQINELFDRAHKVWRNVVEPGTYLHVHVHPGAPTLETPENPSEDDWRRIAKTWYQCYYTFYDKTEEELAYLNAQKDWLKANTPDALQEGVHLLSREGGYCGEDVYVVDGLITHTIHLECGECREYALVHRRDGEQPALWCAHCADFRKPISLAELHMAAVKEL